MRYPVEEARNYIGAIRNPQKRAYATAYFAFISGVTAAEPERPATLSYMAAQAVRMALREIWPGPANDRPLAAPGLTSYRCKSRYGYVMIGAHDPEDAMREARRSSSTASRENLEVWSGEKYVPA